MSITESIEQRTARQEVLERKVCGGRLYRELSDLGKIGAALRVLFRPAALEALEEHQQGSHTLAELRARQARLGSQSSDLF